jgi:hypothetical protein
MQIVFLGVASRSLIGSVLLHVNLISHDSAIEEYRDGSHKTIPVAKRPKVFKELYVNV